MNLLLSYIFSSAVFNQVKKYLPKLYFVKLIRYSFFLVITIVLIFILFNPTGQNETNNCLETIHQYSEVNAYVEIKSVSIFPEIDNLNCFGKISEIKNSNLGTIYVVVTSKLFINLFNLMFGVIFCLCLFYRDNKVLFLPYSLLYLFIDYILNIYYFQFQFNFIYIITKCLLILLIEYIIFSERELKQLNEFFIVSLISIIYINPLNTSVHPDSLYYLGYAVRGDTSYSAFFGNDHLLIYSYLVDIIYKIFGIFSISLLKIFLSFWLGFLIIKFSEYYKIKSHNRYLFTVLILSFQPFAGGDQFWGSFVPKNFGYLFSFTAIYFLLNKKYVYASILFSFSAYFQLAAFIVWLPFVAIIYLRNSTIIDILKTSTTVALLTSPLLYSLYLENYIEIKSSNIKDSALNYIITDYMGNHVYPFVYKGSKFLRINQDWVDDFLNIGLFYISLIIFSYLYKGRVSQVLRSIQITGIILLCYLGFNFLSPVNSFILLQPYKIITLISLLINLFIITEINQKKLSNGFVVFFMLISLFGFNNRIYNFATYEYSLEKNFSSTESLQKKIVETNTDIIVLPLYSSGSVQSELLDLEILLNIDSFVAYKFFPQTIKDTSTWIDRIEKLENFYDGDCEALKFLNEFIFIHEENSHPCGELITFEIPFYIFEYKS